MLRKQLTAPQTISVARSIAIKYLPYYADALYNLIPHESKKELTLAVTERAVLFYNRDFVLKQGPKFIAAVLVHEVNHLLRKHMKRFRAAVGAAMMRTTNVQLLMHLAQLWNLAADAEINDGHPPQLPLPPGCILPSTYGLPNGKLAEYYFKELRKQQKPTAPSQSDSQEEQDGSHGDQDDSHDEGSGSHDGSQETQEGSGDSRDKGPGQGHCGSCSGHRKPSEPLDGKLGELGRSDAELERIRDQVAESAIAHDKQYGSGVSAGMLWWAKDRLKPSVVRWEQQLASLTRQAVAYQEGMVDYRDDILSPEQSVLGYGPDIPLLPALVAPVPEVMFLVDRSDSMTGRELTEVAQEVPEILRRLSTPIHFGAFDTRMREIKKVATVKEALKLFKGGGGTDFNPIFEALKRMRSNRPSILIIGTDGCGPAPAAPPRGVSVIWLLVGRSAQKPVSPNGTIQWGKFIYTNPELRANQIAA